MLKLTDMSYEVYNGPVVVFDLDDTLYNERDYVLSGFRTVARCLPEEERAFEVMKSEWEADGDPYATLQEAFQGRISLATDELLAIYRSHLPEITLFPHAQEILTTLQQRGVRMGLITDGRAVTQRRKIEALGLERYIAPECIRISGEVGMEKTEPDSWRHFVRLYPEAKRFLYVGDNPAKDFLWPNRLGWTTLMLKSNGRNIFPQPTSAASPMHEAKASIESLVEVSKWL